MPAGIPLTTAVIGAMPVAVPVICWTLVDVSVPLIGESTFAVTGVFTMLTVTLAVSVLPAASIAVPVTTWPTASSDRLRGGGHDAMPASPSSQKNVTVTSVSLLPPGSGAGVTTALIFGGDKSTFTDTDA